MKISVRNITHSVGGEHEGVRNGRANGNLMMKANLFGFEGKDVNVSVSGNIPTIKGEKKKETEK